LPSASGRRYGCREATHGTGNDRGALSDFVILTVWRDPPETADHVTWARDFFGGMQPHASGVYVNNLGAEGAERVKAAYAPTTYERLVALKQTYDPRNVLHVNQNIAPRLT
jgi:FAD/FMN-containing dehydrogenase